MTIINKARIEEALKQARGKMRKSEDNKLSERYIEAKASVKCFEYVLLQCTEMIEVDERRTIPNIAQLYFEGATNVEADSNLPAIRYHLSKINRAIERHILYQKELKLHSPQEGMCWYETITIIHSQVEGLIKEINAECDE